MKTLKVAVRLKDGTTQQYELEDDPTDLDRVRADLERAIPDAQAILIRIQ